MTAAIPETLAALRVPTTQLIPYEANPRRGNLEAIAASLEHHGQYRPIVVNRRDDRILAGNHTFHAARQLGWTEIAVTYVDVDEDQAARIVLVDNRSNDTATYDDQALADLLADLPDLAGTGFDAGDLEELLANLGDEPTRNTDPDDVPAPPQIPTSQTGDIWQLGAHRLAVGDACDPEVVAAALDGQPAQLVLTDPPYNVDYTGKTADALKIASDHMSREAFETFLADAYTAMLTNAEPGCPIYVFHATAEELAFRAALEDTGWDYKQTLVWIKDRFVLSRQDYHWQHEPILYGWKPGAAHSWYGGFTPTTIAADDQPDLDKLSKAELLELAHAAYATTTALRCDRPARSVDHPTAKPTALLSRLIENSSRHADLVLDPFGGSGSTLIACHGTRRRAALVEMDPIYADVICRRYQEHTGTIPTRDEQPHDFLR